MASGWISSAQNGHFFILERFCIEESGVCGVKSSGIKFFVSLDVNDLLSILTLSAIRFPDYTNNSNKSFILKKQLRPYETSRYLILGNGGVEPHPTKCKGNAGENEQKNSFHSNFLYITWFFFENFIFFEKIHIFSVTILLFSRHIL